VAVTSHAYPYAIQQIGLKAISLTADTFVCGLCTGSAATWGATQEAYKFVTDITGAYTEVSSGGYARVTLTTLTYSSGSGTAKNIWTCTNPAPISFGAAITLTAASMFVYDHTVGGTDATSPVICIVDFGGSVTSTAGPWTFTVDAVNGLVYWTES
jgi:hypothetical protein